MNRLLSAISTLLVLLLTACANPGGGPDGGPYDETPPRIVEMSPRLGGVNEQAKKVTITFDELIKVEQAQEKITISPPQMEMPEIKVSGRHITIQLADSLKPNTTYTVDFSDAIVDNNEGNPLGNFTYYFSTGEEVDTMEVAGYVLNAENLEPIKGINVGLHSNVADSAFMTTPFLRVGRTDANGHFTIKGVKPGSYRIYALKDMDGDFKYAHGEMLAFQQDLIQTGQYPDVRHDTVWIDTVRIDTIREVHFTHYTPDDVVLLAFAEKLQVQSLLKTEREPQRIRFYFTAPMQHAPKVEPLNFTPRWVEQHSAGLDTLTYWLADSTLVNTDSLRLALTYEATNDSTGRLEWRTDTLDLVPRLTYERRQKLQAAEIEKWQKGLEKRHKRGDYSQERMPVEPLRLKYSARSALAPDQNIYITSEEPLARLDTSMIHLFLKVDSTYVSAPYRLQRDSLNLLRYELKAAWRPGQEYVLNVDSASATTLLGKVNMSYDAKFRISTNEDYGSLFLLIPQAPAHSVVQLMSAGERVRKQLPVQNGRVDFFYLEPGTYYARLFVDDNENGRWDTGSFEDGKQAEAVRYFPNSFTIRANWDLEQTWQLNAWPLYQQKPRELVKQKETMTKKSPQNRNAEREKNKR